MRQETNRFTKGQEMHCFQAANCNLYFDSNAYTTLSNKAYVLRIPVRVSDTTRIGYDTYPIRHVSDTRIRTFSKKHRYGDTARII